MEALRISAEDLLELDDVLLEADDDLLAETVLITSLVLLHPWPITDTNNKYLCKYSVTTVATQLDAIYLHTTLL